MECTTKFNDFISVISLTDSMKQELRTAYKDLKSKLNSNIISKDIITMFLQGSYARHTGVRPISKDDKLDVDLVVVTRFDYRKMSPQQALKAVVPFLEENYKGKYRIQGRSIGIKLGKCSIDLVPTALPNDTVQSFLSEAFNNTAYEESFFRADSTINAIKKYAKIDGDWKKEPLKIPDRDAGKWDDTHPIAQILWTQEMNDRTNGEYIHMVRAIKWWKKNYCKNSETIKSYPLEHFIGNCCSVGKDGLATLITNTLNTMASNSETVKPYLPDRGVPQHDVFGRVEDEDYKNFILTIRDISIKAKDALQEQDLYESSLKWRSIFGPCFPIYDKPKSDTDEPKFTKREDYSKPDKPSRYA